MGNTLNSIALAGALATSPLQATEVQNVQEESKSSVDHICVVHDTSKTLSTLQTQVELSKNVNCKIAPLDLSNDKVAMAGYNKLKEQDKDYGFNMAEQFKKYAEYFSGVVSEDSEYGIEIIIDELSSSFGNPGSKEVLGWFLDELNNEAEHSNIPKSAYSQMVNELEKDLAQYAAVLNIKIAKMNKKQAEQEIRIGRLIAEKEELRTKKEGIRRNIKMLDKGIEGFEKSNKALNIAEK